MYGQVWYTAVQEQGYFYVLPSRSDSLWVGRARHVVSLDMHCYVIGVLDFEVVCGLLLGTRRV